MEMMDLRLVVKMDPLHGQQEFFAAWQLAPDANIGEQQKMMSMESWRRRVGNEEQQHRQLILPHTIFGS